MRIEKNPVAGGFDVYVRYEHSPDFNLTLEELVELQIEAGKTIMLELIKEKKP
jgi:hypothetical protein